ncbi:MAG: hypothetical protein EXS17_06355 [Phycisphaerales bacterium]|nr:hypothetical protein [Phycisphaerales bacterium]
MREEERKLGCIKRGKREKTQRDDENDNLARAEQIPTNSHGVGPPPPAPPPPPPPNPPPPADPVTLAGVNPRNCENVIGTLIETYRPVPLWFTILGGGRKSYPPRARCT